MEAKSKILSSLIVSAAIVITAFALSSSWEKTHDIHETIKVTGLAQQNFISDLIVWKGSFNRKSIDMKAAYAMIKKDQESLRDYFSKKGINSKDIVFSSVIINKEFKNIFNNEGVAVSSEFDGYSLVQEVMIESSEVDKIEKVSREVTELIDIGVEFNSFQPEYYYTKLSELKINMLAEATKDGYTRAVKIAENAQNRIGDLKNAVMGVFQITAQNSSEDFSWGGSFNTTSKRKTASITVKLEFEIK